MAVPRYPHLIVPTAPDDVRFTSTRSGRDKFTTPPRNRGQHAGHLIQSVENARAQRLFRVRSVTASTSLPILC
jgi:hypothetical protein